MRILIIGDAITSLKPKTDSSLAFTREALTRTYEVHWATSEDLFLWGGRVHARVEQIKECHENSHPTSEKLKESQSINSYDSVWIRKDPPFDSSYFSMCWLLALEENNVPMVNKPSLLLRYHEKMLPWEALERGFLNPEEVIPTFLPTGRKFNIPADFPRGESVLKPWLGHGGKDVRLIASPESPEPFTMLQPLQKDIYRTGDRRIFFLDGEILGSFTRLPPPGEIKANIASGGTGLMKDMTKKEAQIADRLGQFLKEIGIAFAGVDMIQEKISEVNITSPTGFLTYYSLGGPKLTPQYLNYIESLI